MRKIVRLAIAAGLLVVAAAAQDHPHPQGPHWQLTDSETLWTGRYSNCQYGYYFLLPADVVAHAEHPPSPHHGFLVRLPETSVKSEVLWDNSDRLVWVNAEYNVTEHSSLKGVTDYEIDITATDKKDFKLIERRPTTLHGRPAAEFKVEYDTPNGAIIEEQLVVLRDGVLYEFGLKTTAEHSVEDHRTFRQLLTGLHFTPIPQGQCFNY